MLWSADKLFCCCVLLCVVLCGAGKGCAWLVLAICCRVWRQAAAEVAVPHQRTSPSATRPCSNTFVRRVGVATNTSRGAVSDRD